MQPPGVLDGEDVGGRHHLAQPRDRRRRAGPRGAPPSTSRPLTCTSLSRRRCQTAPHTLSGMAVLAPERADPGPRGPGAPGPSRRWPLPRPRRDTIPPLPLDGRLSWVLTAVLGRREPGQPALGHQLSGRQALRRGVLPARGARAADAGASSTTAATPFIVHPPLGKWLIALGEQLFGYNSFGWRFPSAVAGAVAVVVLTRLARRLTGSTLLGLLAGLLLALDGFSFSLVPDRPARRLPAGVRRVRRRLPGRRPGHGPRPGPGRWTAVAGSGSAPAAGGSRRGSSSAAPAR